MSIDDEIRELAPLFLFADVLYAAAIIAYVFGLAWALPWLASHI